MTAAPQYGETPLDGDELDSLVPSVRGLLGDALTKVTVYDLEQAIQEEVAEDLLSRVLGGEVGLDSVLTDNFVRDLHRQLYQDVWIWGGRFRQHELNLGVAPEQISEELRATLGTVLYRWEHTEDWSPRELGMAVHAEVVRIHPFADGNGRTTRLLADLVYVATQDGDTLFQYDWQVDKVEYINSLRRFDQSRDVRELAALVPVRSVDQ